MEELLREEEAGYEERLWGPEGEVGIVDVFHVGSGEHAVLLGGEVEDEGGGGEPFCCGVGDAHDVGDGILCVSYGGWDMVERL